MTKRPTPQNCVHCLVHSTEMSWDHVFPTSWYPDTTPADVEKWAIPSCIRCNHSYGQIEQDFLSRVALALDPDHPASRSVIAKAMRGTDPTIARSDRDKRARDAKRKSLIDSLMTGDAIPREATFPGMQEKWDRPIEEQVAIAVSVDSVKRMASKIVRGIFHVVDKKLIEPPFEIEQFVVHEAEASGMHNILDRFGTEFSRPPGITVRRAVVPDDGMSSVFEITFWQQMKIYAVVEKIGN